MKSSTASNAGDRRLCQAALVARVVVVHTVDGVLELALLFGVRGNVVEVAVHHVLNEREEEGTEEEEQQGAGPAYVQLRDGIPEGNDAGRPEKGKRDGDVRLGERLQNGALEDASAARYVSRGHGAC